MVAERLPVKTVCRMLQLTCGGYYAWLVRPPSVNNIGTIDSLRVADRRDLQGPRWLPSAIGRASHPRGAAPWWLNQWRPRSNRVADAASWPQGHVRPKEVRRTPSVTTALVLVTRQFERDDPDELRVTNITEHPTREGRFSCAVVLDTYSRRFVGWSINSSLTAAPVTNALGMVIDACAPQGTTIYSD